MAGFAIQPGLPTLDSEEPFILHHLLKNISPQLFKRDLS